jgi:hypothetical protein
VTRATPRSALRAGATHLARGLVERVRHQPQASTGAGEREEAIGMVADAK